MSPWLIAAIAVAVVTVLAFVWLRSRKDTLEVGAPPAERLELPPFQPRPATAVPAEPAGSVADEIDKLWRLKEAGALTAEEFEQQKSRLMAGPVLSPAGNTLVLTHTGDNKIAVIKLVREITHLGLKEAKDTVESTPQVIAEGLTQAQTDHLITQFAAIGATVELR